MADANRTNNTEQQQRFINNLWQHQQKNEFCDFTLTTNNTAIRCHKLVLSSASSYFSQLLCDSEQNTDTVDVTPLPEHILRTVVALMYNTEFVIDDDNVIELLNFSGTWKLDTLAELCLAYMYGNIPINNSCGFFAWNDVDRLLNQINKTFTKEVKPSGYCGKGICYIGKDRSMYQFVSTVGTYKSVKKMDIPEWVDSGSAVASHRGRMVIVGGCNRGAGDKRVLLIDMTDSTRVTQLPDLPEPRHSSSVVLSDNDVYVVGGYNNKSGFLSSVYYLSLGSNEWQTKESLPHAIQSVLMIQYQQCIYVLGGDNNCGVQSSVLQYNIQDDTWKQCSDIPEAACGSCVAGVVVQKNRIKVFTEDKCLIYADDTDTWTVKHYNDLGEAVNVFVRGGQIYAAVEEGDSHSMMSYDDVDNVWQTEHQRIANAWLSWLFC